MRCFAIFIVDTKMGNQWKLTKTNKTNGKPVETSENQQISQNIMDILSIEQLLNLL